MQEFLRKCGSAVYLNMVYHVTSRWRSYSPGEQCKLAASGRAMAALLLAKLEKEHGEVGARVCGCAGVRVCECWVLVWECGCVGVGY